MRINFFKKKPSKREVLVKESEEGLKVIKEGQSRFQAVHSPTSDSQCEKSDYHKNKPDFTANFKPSSLVAKRKLTSTSFSTQKTGTNFQALPGHNPNLPNRHNEEFRLPVLKNFNHQTLPSKFILREQTTTRPHVPSNTSTFNSPTSYRNLRSLQNPAIYCQPELSATNHQTYTLTTLPQVPIPARSPRQLQTSASKAPLNSSSQTLPNDDDDDLDITCRVSKLLLNITPYSGKNTTRRQFSDFLRQLETAIKLHLPSR